MSKHSGFPSLAFASSLLVALSITDCGSDSSPSLASGDPVPYDQFCAKYVQALCAQIEACGCGAAAVDQCREGSATVCNDPNHGFVTGPIQDAINAGRIVYDAEAARALLAKFDGKSCGLYYDALGIHFGDLYTLGGVFRGQVQEGQTCSTTEFVSKGGISECTEGVCVKTADGSTRRCVGFKGLNETCTTGDASNTLCVDKNHGPDSDNEFASSIDPFRCTATTPGSAQGICATSLPNDSECDDNDQCASGRCFEHKCIPFVAEGGSCSDPQECATRLCTASHCAPALEDGQSCSADTNCKSGACIGSANQQQRTCQVPPMRAIGESCRVGDECASGLCSEDKCTPAFCEPFVTKQF